MPIGCVQRSAWAAIVATALVGGSVYVTLESQTPRSRVDVRVTVTPTPFSGSDGQTHLAYELSFIGLTGTTTARLDRVDVFAESDLKPLISYTSNDLDNRVMRPEADRKDRYGRTLRSGT